MNPELEAYPQYAVYLTILAGTLLAFSRPRWLFYAVAFALTITDMISFSYTRLQIAGPYFNYLDLLTVFGFVAALLNPYRERTKPIETQWYMIAAYLVISFLPSYAEMDLNYNALRFARMAAGLPAAWFIGHGGIVTRRDAEVVLWIVVIGCFVQSLRQCWIVAFPPEKLDTSSALRTLRYLNSGMVIVPLCALAFPIVRNRWASYFLVVDAAVSVVALILTQTRSMLIPQVLIIAVAAFFLHRRIVLRIAVPLAISLAVFILFYRSLNSSRLDVVDMLLHGRLADFSSGTGREDDIAIETSAWLNSNLIFGRGLAYMYGREFHQYDIAWAHNGYVSYLSNLGLIGFYLYAIEIPRIALGNAKTLRRSDDTVMSAYGAMLTVNTWYVILLSALSGGLLGGSLFMLFLLLLGGSRSLAAEAQTLDETAVKRPLESQS